MRIHPQQSDHRIRREPKREVDLLARNVIGAAIEVHKILGPGFLESVYERALCQELRLRETPFSLQRPLPISYKGTCVGEGRIDLLVADSLVVELKAVDCLAPIHTAQVISYLKATGLHLGLLINFNVEVLRTGIKRVIVSQ